MILIKTKTFLIATLMIFRLFALAQEENASMSFRVDNLTYDWDKESKTISNYTGLLAFCNNLEYRNSIIELLNEIHHIDSVLYERAKQASKRSSNSEIEKLIKDIEKFESQYSMRKFLVHLKEECVTQKEIEKNKVYTKNEVGEESYDGQILLLENELHKYIKHITKRVDTIRKHVHHLHIK